MAAPNQPLWVRSLPPAAASGTFRGHALLVLGSEVHVFGHDVDPAAPLLTSGRRRRVDLAQGISKAVEALALPQGGVLLAAASDGAGVALVSTRLGGSAPAALLRRVDGGGAQTLAETGPTGSGPLVLHAVTALVDGTWVAVGSAETKTGSAAMWLRFSAGWPQSCD